MNSDERHMLAFTLLAEESHSRQQHHGELRFLILAGTAACHAGWLEVASRCYQRVKEINPHHLLANHSTLPVALKSEDFQTFLQRLVRFCSFEQAELLLEKHAPEWKTQAETSSLDLGQQCLDHLP